MRERFTLLLSLLCCAALTVMVLLLARDLELARTEPSPLVAKSSVDKAQPRQVRSQVVVRRQLFNWSDIESNDYPTYILNLRRIGCPEKTIRDIIVADVTALYSERLETDIVLPEQEWWKADPDMDVFQAAADQIRALEDEKEALLTQLLGPGWNPPGANPRGAPIRLDGPVLSHLAPELKGEIFQIEANLRRSIDTYLRKMLAEQREPDPAELARLRQEGREALAKRLSPEAMEEYLLRYSSGAESLRQQLRGFGADSTEFRTIFRARDPYDQQLAQLTGDDPATVKRRADIESIRDEALRQALGPERYPLYQMTQNPLFREAQEQAESNGAPPEKVLPIFEVNRLTAEELQRLRGDTTLSEEERLAAIEQVQSQQRASVRRLLAGEPPPPPVPQ